MSARSKDARAAMDTILYSVLTGDTDPMTPADVAHDAWGYAAAMAAERAKRETPEAPCPWRFDCIDCGVGISVDEDGCCKTCGRDAVTVKDGVPDYSAFAKGEAEMPEPAPGRDDERAKLKEACEKARREGRDAGLREAIVKCMSHSCSGWAMRAEFNMLAEALRALMDESVAPAPDVAALRSENAKLRAVAEAAAVVTAAVHRGRAGADADQWSALIAALDAAIPGWRTK